jgi:hypothetical protein
VIGKGRKNEGRETGRERETDRERERERGREKLFPVHFWDMKLVRNRGKM